MVMRNTLANHLKVFGDLGHFTYHASQDVNDAENIDAASYREAALRKLEVGQTVYIRGTSEPLVIEHIQGVFVTMPSYGDRGFRRFYEVAPKWGSYTFGRIKVYKAHLVLEPAVLSQQPHSN